MGRQHADCTDGVARLNARPVSAVAVTSRTYTHVNTPPAPPTNPAPEWTEASGPGSSPDSAPVLWREGAQVPLLARNVLLEYTAIAVNIAIGVIMLPFNIHHLGQSAYGLWVLTVSVTTYFSLLDLGYGSAQVKFAAQYRALRNTQAINEIVSTLFFLFLGIACLVYVAAVVVSFNLGHLFHLNAEQARIGRAVLLTVSVGVALGFPFSVFGGLVNGFQRYYQNTTIAIVASVIIATINVVVLSLGYGIVELVAATTAYRVINLFAYRRSAYRAFPPLQVRWSLVRRERLREVSAFSVYLLIIDIAGKINFTSDTMVIGAFMNTAAIAVWSVPNRLIDMTRMSTRVLSVFLFPTIVGSAAQNRLERLRLVLVHSTRLSLAMAIPMAATTAMLGRNVILAWVGPRFLDGVPLLSLFAVIVVIRMGGGTAGALLKGADGHRLLAGAFMALAITNLLLSIVFVRWFGLVGVALGTLIPVAVFHAVVFFPAACRRVEIPVAEAVRKAVWPALWPAVPTMAFLWLVRDSVGPHLVLLGATAFAAAALYEAVFLWGAVPTDDRRWYLEKINGLLRRTGIPAAA